MWRELKTRETKALLVIRNDRIIYEKYGNGWNEKRKHYTASLAKALVGGTSLMLAVDDRLLSIDDKACKLIPQWQAHLLKSRIAIRHMATHSSGIEDAEEEIDRSPIPHKQLQGWKGAFWRQDPDPFTISRDKARVLFDPGTAYHYSNPGMAMLSYAVTAALKNSPYKDIRSLLRERIMSPLGVPEDEWSIGYEKTFHVDGLDLVPNWGGGSFTARAVARIGRLMLQKGEWEGHQLVSPARIMDAVSYAGTPLPPRPAGNPQPSSGICWWTNSDGVWHSIPRDAFAGAGAGNQLLLVIPSLDMIVVRNGGLLGDESRGEGFWGGLEKYLFDPLMNALLIHPPYPQSPVITAITWAPVSSITRLATGGKKRDGSDNWPMTWADDDNLYTAYGDGYGFSPVVSEKLGLGFGVVRGNPENGITCFNIRSNAENSLYGKSGKKASGMLMVDGILYMWARNADNNGNHSQLAWSSDYAKTWTWCDWKFEEFGYPTFINFGRNYNDARDEYVYIVSHDNKSAYETADRFVLMRVPKDQIRDRSAYGFLTGLDRNNNPVWTPDINERGGVFINPDSCCRSGITYNSALKRYLWWQQLPTTSEDTRYEGGFGIYDAAEPWGPWTTVYFTEKWDVGPGETATFPTKWMSSDGVTIYLVFSGNDSLSLRKATLTLAE
jgi:CubicO group peptidase (beta-lactamase class C family)